MTFFARVRRFLWKSFLWFNIISVVMVIVYRFVPIPYTLTMLSRNISTGKANAYTWKSYDEISPNVPLAMVASEDQLFPTHHGFDFKQMKKAMEKNEKSGEIRRGGSTISQQVAKNVFLWQHQSYFRKGLEAYYTVLIELFWSKKRILEVYMNVCETGINTFGVEEGAKRYYGKSAKDLTQREAAEIATVLPNPQKRDVGEGKTGHVLKNMRNLGSNYLKSIE